MGKSAAKSGSKKSTTKKKTPTKDNVVPKKTTAKKSVSKKSVSKKSVVVKEVPTTKSEPVVEPVVSAEDTSSTDPVVKKPLTPSLSSTANLAKVPDMPLEDNITGQISTLLNTISSLVGELKNVQTQVKTLEKNYIKVLKDHNKTLNKKKKGDRKPSGFAKPSKISEEMATFLSLDPKEEIPRNQITKLINAYIIEHNLRNEKDKREIHPDAKLSKLLNLKGDEQLSYFNLQKYMKHHFIKTPVAAV